MTVSQDFAVTRLKKQPRPQYKAPEVTYRCRLCKGFSSNALADAWTHSMYHGPWPIEGSMAEADALKLSAQSHAAGLAHPRNHLRAYGS